MSQLQASGESKVRFLDLYDPEAFTDMGCNGHPNAAMQQRVATKLAGVIQTLGI